MNVRRIRVAVTIVALSCAATFAQENTPQAGQAGIRVWNGDVLAPYLELIDGGSGKPLGPMTLVGARNGTFSGEVVVGSSKPITGLKATMSELVHANGAGKIADVLVRFPTRSGYSDWNSTTKGVVEFDALEAKPPAEVPLLTNQPTKRAKWATLDRAYQPVWVTVSVPVDAKPGKYEGTLAIAATGAGPVKVPVALTVHDYRLPEAKDVTTCVDFVQSPESVAMVYDVPFWSDKHFALMGKSFDLIGKAGNRSVNLYLVCETNHGNAETMVRWIKDGDGYRHDFTILEKYLDLAIAHGGTPKMVFLYVWDYQYNERKEPEGFRGCVEASTGEVMVSLAGAGALTMEKLPKYGDPRSKALWKPVIDGVMERLKARDLEKAAVLGWATDLPPSPEVVALFAELAPGVPWAVGSHSFYSHQDQDIVKAGAPVRYATLVSLMRDNRRKPDPAKFFAWKEGDLVQTAYYRGMRDNDPATAFRFMADRPTEGESRGVGRIGVDFWPVLKDKRGRTIGTLSARYPKSGWRNLDVHLTLLARGPDGAVATARYEMFREGLQECEARLSLEEAIYRKTIAPDLAKRCQAVLDAREAVLEDLRKAESRDVDYDGKDAIYVKFIEANWQSLTDRLYAAAAEVAKATARN